MDNPLRINVINRTDTEDFKQLCELIKKFTIDTFIRNKPENSKLKGNKNKELVEKSIREFEGLEDLSVLSSKDIEKLNAGIKNQIESAKNLIEKNQTETRYSILKDRDNVVAFMQAQVKKNKGKNRIEGWRNLAYIEPEYSGKVGETIDTYGNIHKSVYTKAMYDEIGQWFEENNVNYERTCTGVNMISNIQTYIYHNGFLPFHKNERNIFLEKDLRNKIDSKTLIKIYKLYCENRDRNNAKSKKDIQDEINGTLEFKNLSDKQKQGLVECYLQENEKDKSFIDKIQQICNQVDSRWRKRKIVDFVHIELGKILTYDNSGSDNKIDKTKKDSDMTKESKTRIDNLLHANTSLENQEQVCKGMAEISALLLNTLGVEAKVIGVEEKGDINGAKKYGSEETIIVPEIYSVTFDKNKQSIIPGKNEQKEHTDTKPGHYYTEIYIDGEEPIIQDYMMEGALARIKIGESTLQDDIIPGLCTHNDYKIRVSNPIPIKQSFVEKLNSDIVQQFGTESNINDKVEFLLNKLRQEKLEYGFEEVNDCLKYLINEEEIKNAKKSLANLIKEDKESANVVCVYNINDINYLIRGNMERLDNLPQIGKVTKEQVDEILKQGFEPRGKLDQDFIGKMFRNQGDEEAGHAPITYDIHSSNSAETQEQIKNNEFPVSSDFATSIQSISHNARGSDVKNVQSELRSNIKDLINQMKINDELTI